VLRRRRETVHAIVSALVILFPHVPMLWAQAGRSGCPAGATVHAARCCRSRSRRSRARRAAGAFGDTVTTSMANQVSELAPLYVVRRDLATDRSIGFALLHLPPIYDRSRDAFSWTTPEAAGYFDTSCSPMDRSPTCARRWSAPARGKRRP
jgi:hypothetical protein